MWVVLGATVGLAALQTHQRVSPAQVTLPMNVFVLGPWHVRVPEDWATTEQGDRAMEFHEPLDPEARSIEEEGGRELAVELDFVDPRMTPFTYVAEKLHVESLQNAALIPMCGQQGVMVSEQVVVGDENGAEIVAGTVMPSGDAIELVMRVPRRITPSDLALAEIIATTVAYAPKSNGPGPSPHDQGPVGTRAPDDGD